MDTSHEILNDEVGQAVGNASGGGGLLAEVSGAAIDPGDAEGVCRPAR